MDILKSWQRQTEEQLDVLEVTAGKVYVACYEGEDCSAVGCTHAEFRAGKLHGVVREIFGEAVLAEALQYLRPS
ncbi:MAG: hypothetical protein K0R03_279 [Moraxellaceae bacterium]|nr:hypothetical protein [Moraxellaceae bacterium]MDF3029721.1 hypothetical protein [Moraxellaceae bacterium]